ncbi:hypothetical protein ACFSLT_28390 [Novosphingobium resinovorum]
MALDGVTDDSIRAVMIEEAVRERSVGVLWLASRPLSRPAQAMMDALRQVP